MPATSVGGSMPVPLEEIPFLSHAVLALAAMPPPMRNARLLLLDALLSLPNEELAIIAKAVQRHLTDEEIAALVGVTIRTVQRWERYQSFKTTLADYLESKRRQYYLPDDSAA
jgi:DNA-directed RNA polymerase specialized sigma24 family protein